ncbi:hypothetical protein V8D89_012458 [Ganoderma adspersum]
MMVILRRLHFFELSRFNHPSSLFAADMEVLTLYCWIFTFDEELARVWMGRVTGATVLFTLNRYLGILYSTLSAIQGLVSLSDKLCDVASKVGSGEFIDGAAIEDPTEGSLTQTIELPLSGPLVRAERVPVLPI